MGAERLVGLLREFFAELGRVAGDSAAEALAAHPLAAGFGLGGNPDGARERRERREALVVFGWDADRERPTEDEVRTRWKALRRRLHPDAAPPDEEGAARELFARLSRARDVLLAWARAED